MNNKQINTTNSFMSKTLLFLCFSFALISLQGQTRTPSQNSRPVAAVKEYCPHQISLWGAGGLSTLLYTPSLGERSSGLGGNFGLGYTYYFSRNFGILAGAELAFYNSKLTFDALSGSYRTKDADGVNIDYNTVTRDYEEHQRLTNVNIPIMFQYQSQGTHKFYASLGLKLGIPVSGKSRSSEDFVITASGNYYDTHRQEFYDQRDLGYGRFTGVRYEEDIDFNLTYIGSAEAGMKWRLNNILSLYTGVYAEYGFNDAVDSRTDRFLAYNRLNPREPQVNSALTSEYTRNGQSESFTGRVSPFAVGLKLRLGVDLCCKDKDKTVKATPAPKPAPAPKPVPAPKPAPAPVIEEKAAPVQEAVPQEAPQSSRARAREILASRPQEEFVDEKPLQLPPPPPVAPAKKESNVDMQRASSEYKDLKGMITIELEGYELDQSTLSAKMERILDEKIAEIRSTYGENIRIVCEGHTCNVGRADYNVKLGLKRANVVRDYLINKGDYRSSRVTAVSKGPDSPIAPNDTEDNRKKNRRVVLIIRDL